jgi:hypothetical protein
MATISRTKATLRIAGDALMPEEVSKMLGVAPTSAQRKGQDLRGASGVSRIAKFGMWRFQAAEASPGDLDAQVQEILGQLTDDMAIWDRISALYDVDLFCGWFMKAENEGMEISANTLRALGARGIELSLDIYSGDGDKPICNSDDSDTPQSGR